MPLMDVPAVSGMNPAAAQAWFGAEFAKDRLFKEIEPLSEDQLFQVPAGFRNSIATLLCHIAATEMSFAHSLVGKPMADELKAEYFMGRNENLLIEPKGETKESLIGKFERAHATLKETLQQLSPEDLERTFDRPNGVQVTARWMLNLVGYHAALHYGHIQMVKQHLK